MMQVCRSAGRHSRAPLGRGTGDIVGRPYKGDTAITQCHPITRQDAPGHARANHTGISIVNVDAEIRDEIKWGCEMPAVVLAICECCGQAIFVESREVSGRRQSRGEAICCTACLECHDDSTESMIRAREARASGERVAAGMLAGYAAAPLKELIDNL